MQAADVMVSNVITVGVDATIAEVADTLLRHHISGVPVVGEKGELVGIVSEGDLLRRPETGTLRRPSWWLAFLSSERAFAAEYIKSHSRKVANVMTRRVISATPDTSLGEIAAMLERNRIKRVPVLDGGKLVGIVTRANVLQALASASRKLASLASADDSQLRKSVVDRLSAEPWCPTMLAVTVADGTVDLWGVVHSDEERKAARLAAELAPGVGAVVDNLIVQPPASGSWEAFAHLRERAK